MDHIDFHALADAIKQRALQLGFQQLGITDTGLSEAESYLMRWLKDGRHGDMHWMARHGQRRSRPRELVPGTVRVISARMDYLPGTHQHLEQTLADPKRAYVSCYAWGRDYHKLVRKRLQQLADWMQTRVGEFGYRVFVDSAPVMEKPLAQKAGVGWIGKHTNLLHRQGGSWFFLGEIYTDLPLPVDTPAADHCGTCRRCMEVCPTGAIVAPYELDARLCISYLTIELPGPIPVQLRPLIGNRIYGCDDCQLFCPWNRFARLSAEPDFQPRHALDSSDLVSLFAWDEATFLANTAGSAIRRIGHERWLRNIAVALGNAPTSQRVVEALRARSDHASELVREHVAWALAQHGPAQSPDD